jgi:hypothetical protein
MSREQLLDAWTKVVAEGKIDRRLLQQRMRQLLGMTWSWKEGA